MNIKEQIDVIQAAQNGSRIELRDSDKIYRELRDATEHEFNFENYRYRIKKPKEPTLEEKVKAKYPDYEVCMLRINEGTGWLSYGHNGTSRVAHSAAQSDPRFAGYIYDFTGGAGGDLTRREQPTYEYIQPIAVLFTRDK
jgi:hypothetical protein